MKPSTVPARFTDLGLSEPALKLIAKAGFERPTPVQTQAIPPALAGRDIVACAGTGTGKTAAFVLPIVERLVGGKGTRALVLAPTRELVTQIAECFRDLGASRGISGVTIVGGMGMAPQIKGLRERRDVVVATPGRLVDLIDRGNAHFGALEVLVLDEADRMLDMGFRRQLDQILKALPRQRQTILCSATMGDEVRRYSKAWLNDPVRIEVIRSGTVAERVTQRAFRLSDKAKIRLLLALLAENDTSTLVFTRTKRRANKVMQYLEASGISVARIHGNRSQPQRQKALDGFRKGTFRVLVATDVAARGIDVQDIGHVVNFDLSLVPDDHVHRVGRTARAEASGLASSFCAPDEVPLLRAIERFTRTEIPHAELPDGIPTSIPAPAVVRTTKSTSSSSRPRSGGQKPGGHNSGRRSARARPGGGSSSGRPAGGRARLHRGRR